MGCRKLVTQLGCLLLEQKPRAQQGWPWLCPSVPLLTAHHVSETEGTIKISCDKICPLTDKRPKRSTVPKDTVAVAGFTLCMVPGQVRAGEGAEQASTVQEERGTEAKGCLAARPVAPHDPTLPLLDLEKRGNFIDFFAGGSEISFLLIILLLLFFILFNF